MRRKNLPVCLTLILITVVASIAGPAVAQLQPTADLLVPYFEVGLQPDGITTLFAVGDALDKPVDLVATVRTNWGIPVLKVPLTLKPHEVRTVNLRDWLKDGGVPGVALSDLEREHLEAALSGRLSPKDGLYYSTEVEPDLAVGSVTLHAQGERPDALWGDWFVVDDAGNLARGDVLVNIDLGTGPPGLCERHLLRYLSGGNFDAGTSVVVWRDVSLAPSASAFSPVHLQANATTYSEPGALLDLRALDLLPVEKVSIATLGLSEPFGSIDLLTDGDSFVGVEHTAEGRYSVGLQAWCLKPEAGGPGGPAVGPGLRIATLVDGEDADLPPGPVVPQGSMVTWEYVVRNVGGTPVIDIVVTDDQGAAVSCPIDSLAPGQSMTCSAIGTADACQHGNVGSVAGRSPDGVPAEDSDPGHYFGAEDSALALELSVDFIPEVSVPVGSPIVWSLRVVNAGRARLTGIAVSAAGIPAPTCPRHELSANQSMVCTVREIAAEGEHQATAQAAGQGVCSSASAQAAGSYFGERIAPAIGLMALTNGEDADDPPGPHIIHGNTVFWDYVVTNIGGEALSDIVVTDDQDVTVKCPGSFLAPDETMTCTGDGSALLGQYSNIASVVGVSPEGQVVTATDPSHYFGASPLGEGCSTSYWQNNPGTWDLTGYQTFQTVDSVFSQAASYPPLDAATLFQSLSFPDGPGLQGAANELLRTATTALLNASHPGLDYPRTPAEVIAGVEAALASADQSTLLDLASSLDADNNLGCPLSGV